MPFPGFTVRVPNSLNLAEIWISTSLVLKSFGYVPRRQSKNTNLLPSAAIMPIWPEIQHRWNEIAKWILATQNLLRNHSSNQPQKSSAKDCCPAFKSLKRNVDV